jgi:hypothetical protein
MAFSVRWWSYSKNLRVKYHIDEGFDFQRVQARHQVCSPQSLTLVETMPISTSICSSKGHVLTRGRFASSKYGANVGVNKQFVGPYYYFPLIWQCLEGK